MSKPHNYVHDIVSFNLKYFELTCNRNYYKLTALLYHDCNHNKIWAYRFPCTRSYQKNKKIYNYIL